MGSLWKYRCVWVWGNTIPGTAIWLLKNSGNTEGLIKIAEKVFKICPNWKKKKNLLVAEEKIEELKAMVSGWETMSPPLWRRSLNRRQEVAVLPDLPHVHMAVSCLNAENEECHANSQAWAGKVLKMLLATLEIMVLDLLSEQIMWSLKTLQHAPQNLAISLPLIELSWLSIL